MRATTIRFSDPIYERLEQASKFSGLPINAIVTAACMEWLRQQFPTAAGVDVLADAAADDTESVAVARLLRDRLHEVVPQLTPDALAAILRGRDESRRFGHNYLGTEHLLLGIAARDDSPGGKALQQRGIDAAKVRDSIKFIVGQGLNPTSRVPGLTPRAAAMIERAARLSQERGDGEVNTGHLLLGLCADEQALAVQMAASLGCDVAALREAAEESLG